jgi:hypothetical protein
MKKRIYLMFAVIMIANMSYAGPLLWRGAKTIDAGKPIFMVGFGYWNVDQQWDWGAEEWTDLADASQTTVMNAHFMLGYAPIKKWEIMAHIPFMMKDRDTLSSSGLQDIWLKTRYNFLGGKDQPFVTGVAAVRIPTASEDAEIALDDRTLDIALGAMFMSPKLGQVLLHLKAGYWYNMKNDADYDIGDNIEAIFKIDYIFNKQVKAFLNFTFVETFKMKDADGNTLDNTEKRRLTISPGLVIKPAPGLSIRPKFIYPLEMINKGGSNFTWKIGFDIWYVLK